MRNTKLTDEFSKCYQELESIERRRFKFFQDWKSTKDNVQKLIKSIDSGMLQKLTSTNIKTNIRFKKDLYTDENRPKYYDDSKDELILSPTGFRYINPNYTYRTNSREVEQLHVLEILSNKQLLLQIKDVLVKEKKKYGPAIVDDLIKVSDEIKKIIDFRDEDIDLYKFTDKQLAIREIDLYNPIEDSDEQARQSDSMSLLTTEYRKEVKQRNSHGNYTGYEGNRFLIDNNGMQINGLTIRLNRFSQVMSLYEIKDEVTELFDEVEPKLALKISEVNSVMNKIREELSIRLLMADIKNSYGGN